MAVVIKRKNKYLYAFLKGEIDHHTAPEMREAIDDALSSSESCETLVLDLDDRNYKIMQMSGIEKIAEINKKGDEN